jgi:hypothetical protein
MEEPMKLISAIVFISVILAPLASGAESNIGGGINYWHALEDIDLDEFDQNGASFFLSLQGRRGFLLGWEADIEIMPEGFMASPATSYSPQAYLVVGRRITGAVGIGWYYSDGNWADQPFYILRVGIEYLLIPGISVDIMMNYRFTDWGELEGEDINTDTIMLGAAIRFGS